MAGPDFWLPAYTLDRIQGLMATLWAAAVLLQEPPPTVKINIESTWARSRPSYNASRLQKLNNGEQYRLLGSEAGGWVRIELSAGKEGFIHSTATIEPVKWRPPDPEQGERTQAEIGATTKGFNPKMEREHREKHNLHRAYETLDRIEKMPQYRQDAERFDARIESFSKEGNLKP
jgi:hypothetical protein